MNRWFLLSCVFMIALASNSTPAAQNAASCAPPPEWGPTKMFGKWGVRRVCLRGSDILSVGAASEAGFDKAFSFLCDKEDGTTGMFSLNKITLDGPLSLTLKGGQAPVLKLEALNMAGQATQIDLLDSPETKRFQAALVDGSGPTFTLVLTPTGKPPLELTFSRTGLAAAVKPLRSRCGW